MQVRDEQLPQRDEYSPTLRSPGSDHRVQVSFFTRRGWFETFEVRVRSKGLAVAIWRGVRQARRDNLNPRTRVKQARVVAIAA